MNKEFDFSVKDSKLMTSAKPVLDKTLIDKIRKNKKDVPIKIIKKKQAPVVNEYGNINVTG